MTASRLRGGQPQTRWTTTATTTQLEHALSARFCLPPSHLLEPMLDGFSLDNVSDPTDFLPTAPSLKLLDEALRCSICKDYFEAPMTVNCPSGHCFCSAVGPPTDCFARR